MKRLMMSVTVALLLAGCNGSGGDKASTEAPEAAADVQAGTTKDSADPRLNALQRTKRKLNEADAQHDNTMNQAGESEGQ